MISRLLSQRFGTKIMRVVGLSIVLNLALCFSGLFSCAVVVVQEGVRGKWVENRLMILFLGVWVFGLLLWKHRRYITKDCHKTLKFLNFKTYDVDPNYYAWVEEE